MCIRDIVKYRYGIDLPIHGGSGRDIDDPIFLEITKDNNIIAIEKAVLICLGVINDYDWQPISQTLHLVDNKKVDQIDIQIFEDNDLYSYRIEKYYFEITKCFDRFSADVAKYLAKSEN